MFTIVSNIPAPHNAYKYPFADMKVGDSFFAEGKKVGALNAAAYSWRRKNACAHWSFVAREVEGGTRIWRTK
jgi:hypothetical protein